MNKPPGVEREATRLESVEQCILKASDRLSNITEVLARKVDVLIGDQEKCKEHGTIASCRQGLIGRIEDSLDHLNYKIDIFNEQIERLNDQRAL